MNDKYFEHFMCKHVNDDFCYWSGKLKKMDVDGEKFNDLINLYLQYYKANARNRLARRKMENWKYEHGEDYADKAPEDLKRELDYAIRDMRNIKSIIVDDFNFKSPREFLKTYNAVMKDFKRNNEKLFFPDKKKE